MKDNVISQQEAVIKSLKETIETTKRTIAHKEEVISEQATAIISLQTDCEYNSTDGDGDIGNCNIKLAEANSAIEEKHNEVKNYQSQLQNAYQDNSRLTDEIGSLREILEEDKFNLSEQKKRLHEANIIRKKTEMAYIAHIDTVAVKNQVIDHQKTIIDNQETVIDSLRNTTTNHTLVNTEAVPILNSVHNKNGVITDAVLIWIDVQRMTTAENIWKTQALLHFTTEEISTANSEMWSRCGEQKLGMLIRRQGSSKTKAELDDMSAAFKSLAENDMLPLFIASSETLRRTPIFNVDLTNNTNDAIATRLKILEETINAAISMNKGLMTNNEKMVDENTSSAKSNSINITSSCNADIVAQQATNKSTVNNEKEIKK